MKYFIKFEFDQEMEAVTLVEGQLVEVRYKDQDKSWWQYGVVVKVFNEKVQIKTRTGSVMYTINESDREEWGSKNLHITFLSNGDKWAMAKKNLFGRYKLKTN